MLRRLIMGYLSYGRCVNDPFVLNETRCSSVSSCSSFQSIWCVLSSQTFLHSHTLTVSANPFLGRAQSRAKISSQTMPAILIFALCLLTHQFHHSVDSKLLLIHPCLDSSP